MAARNVTVTFGLLSIPMKIESAIERQASNINLCVGQPGHAGHDPAPIKAPRICDDCGPIVDNTVLVKGVKQGASYAVVSQEDLAEAKATYAGQYKGILTLVPHVATDVLTRTAPGEKTNFLTPANSAAEGHYQLLRQLVQVHPEYAFTALYTPVSATGLYVLSVRDGVLVAEERVRTQAIKPAPSVGGELNEALFAMLESTVEPVEFDPNAYEDKYAMAVEALAQSAESTVSLKSEQAATPVAITDDDLMAKLRALKEAS